MIICHVSGSLFLMLSCTMGVLLAQHFQYSTGWEGGKKRTLGMSTHNAACQLERLKIILEGKNMKQLHWPCDWQNFPPAYDIELRSHGNQSPQPISSPTFINNDDN